MGTLQEDQYAFMIIPRTVLVRMRNVSDKICREIKIHVFSSVTFFFSKIVPFYEIMWEHCGAGQATDDNMAHAHCMLVS